MMVIDRFAKHVLLKFRLKNIARLHRVLEKPSNFDVLVKNAKVVKICSSFLEYSVISRFIVLQISYENDLMRELTNLLVFDDIFKRRKNTTVGEFLEDVLNALSETQQASIIKILQKLDFFIVQLCSPDYGRISPKLREILNSPIVLQVSKLFGGISSLDVSQCEIMMTDFYSQRFQIDKSTTEEKQESLASRFLSKTKSNKSKKFKESTSMDKASIEKMAIKHLMLLKQEQELLKQLKTILIEMSICNRDTTMLAVYKIFGSERPGTSASFIQSKPVLETLLSKLFDLARQEQSTQSAPSNIANSNSYCHCCVMLSMNHQPAVAGYWHALLFQIKEVFLSWSENITSSNIHEASVACNSYLQWSNSALGMSYAQETSGGALTNMQVLECKKILDLEAITICKVSEYLRSVQSHASFALLELSIGEINERGNAGLQLSTSDRKTVIMNHPNLVSDRSVELTSFIDCVMAAELGLTNSLPACRLFLQSDLDWYRLLTNCENCDVENEMIGFIEKLRGYLDVVLSCLKSENVDIPVNGNSFATLQESTASMLRYLGLQQSIVESVSKIRTVCGGGNADDASFEILCESKSNLATYFDSIGTLCQFIDNSMKNGCFMDVIKQSNCNGHVSEFIEENNTVDGIYWLNKWNLTPIIRSWFQNSISVSAYRVTVDALSIPLIQVKKPPTLSSMRKLYPSVSQLYQESCRTVNMVLEFTKLCLKWTDEEFHLQVINILTLCIDCDVSIANRQWVMTASIIEKMKIGLTHAPSEFSNYKLILDSFETEVWIGEHEDSLTALEEQSIDWIENMKQASSGERLQDCTLFTQLSDQSELLLCSLSRSKFEVLSNLSSESRRFIGMTNNEREKLVCERTNDELLFLSNFYCSVLINRERKLVESGSWEEMCVLWKNLRHKNLMSRLYLPHWVLNEISVASYFCFEQTSRTKILESIANFDGMLVLSDSGELICKSHDSNPLSEELVKISTQLDTEKYMKPPEWSPHGDFFLNAFRTLDQLRSMASKDEYLQTCEKLVNELCVEDKLMDASHSLNFIRTEDMRLVFIGKLIFQSYSGDMLGWITETVSQRHFPVPELQFDGKWNHLSQISEELLTEISNIATGTVHVLVASMISSMLKLLDYCHDDTGLGSISADGYDNMIWFFDELRRLGLKYESKKLLAICDLMKDIKSMACLYSVGSNIKSRRAASVTVDSTFYDIVHTHSEIKSLEISFDYEEEKLEPRVIDFDYEDMESQISSNSSADVVGLFEVDYVDFESEMNELKEEMTEEFERRGCIANLLSQLIVCSSGAGSEDISKLLGTIHNFRAVFLVKFTSPAAITIVSVVESLCLLLSDLPKLLNSLSNSDAVTDAERNNLIQLKGFCRCVVPSVLDEVRILLPKWQATELDYKSLTKTPLICNSQSISSILIYAANILKKEKKKIEISIENAERQIVLKECVCLFKVLIDTNSLDVSDFPKQLWNHSSTIAAFNLLGLRSETFSCSQESVISNSAIHSELGPLSLSVLQLSKLRKTATEGDMTSTCQCADALSLMVSQFPVYLRAVIQEEIEATRQFMMVDHYCSSISSFLSVFCVSEGMSCFEYSRNCLLASKDIFPSLSQFCGIPCRLKQWFEIGRCIYKLRSSISRCDWEVVDEQIKALEWFNNEMKIAICAAKTEFDMTSFEKKHDLMFKSELLSEISFSGQCCKCLKLFESFVMDTHYNLSREKKHYFLCSDSGFDTALLDLQAAENIIGLKATQFLHNLRVCINFIMSSGEHDNVNKCLFEIVEFCSFLASCLNFVTIADHIDNLAISLRQKIDQKRLAILQSAHNFIVFFEISTFLKQAESIVCDHVKVDFKLNKKLICDYKEQVSNVQAIFVNDSAVFDALGGLALRFMSFVESTRHDLSKESYDDNLGMPDDEILLRIIYCLMESLTFHHYSKDDLKLCATARKLIETSTAVGTMEVGKKQFFLDLMTEIYAKTCQQVFLDKCDCGYIVEFDSNTWDLEEGSILNMSWPQISVSFGRSLISPSTSSTMECANGLMRTWNDMFQLSTSNAASNRYQKFVTSSDHKISPQSFCDKYSGNSGLGKGLFICIDFMRKFLTITQEFQCLKQFSFNDSNHVDSWDILSANATKSLVQTMEFQHIKVLCCELGAIDDCGNNLYLVDAINRVRNDLSNLRLDYGLVEEIEWFTMSSSQRFIEKLKLFWKLIEGLLQFEYCREPYVQVFVRRMCLSVLSLTACLPFPISNPEARQKMNSSISSLIDNIKLLDCLDFDTSQLEARLIKQKGHEYFAKSLQLNFSEFTRAFNSVNDVIMIQECLIADLKTNDSILIMLDIFQRQIYETFGVAVKIAAICEMDTNCVFHILHALFQSSNEENLCAMVLQLKAIISCSSSLRITTLLLVDLEAKLNLVKSSASFSDTCKEIVDCLCICDALKRQALYLRNFDNLFESPESGVVYDYLDRITYRTSQNTARYSLSASLLSYADKLEEWMIATLTARATKTLAFYKTSLAWSNMNKLWFRVVSLLVNKQEDIDDNLEEKQQPPSKPFIIEAEIVEELSDCFLAVQHMNELSSSMIDCLTNLQLRNLQSEVSKSELIVLCSPCSQNCENMTAYECLKTNYMRCKLHLECQLYLSSFVQAQLIPEGFQNTEFILRVWPTLESQGMTQWQSDHVSENLSLLTARCDIDLLKQHFRTAASQVDTCSVKSLLELIKNNNFGAFSNDESLCLTHAKVQTLAIRRKIFGTDSEDMKKLVIFSVCLKFISNKSNASDVVEYWTNKAIGLMKSSISPLIFWTDLMLHIIDILEHYSDEDHSVLLALTSIIDSVVTLETMASHYFSKIEPIVEWVLYYLCNCQKYYGDYWSKLVRQCSTLRLRMNKLWALMLVDALLKNQIYGNYSTAMEGRDAHLSRNQIRPHFFE